MFAYFITTYLIVLLFTFVFFFPPQERTINRIESSVEVQVGSNGTSQQVALGVCIVREVFRRMSSRKQILTRQYSNSRSSISNSNSSSRGTRWRSWLRHRATSRKVAGSISDGVIGFFSGRTMALKLVQPLTESSTRSVSWG